MARRTLHGRLRAALTDFFLLAGQCRRRRPRRRRSIAALRRRTGRARRLPGAANPERRGALTRCPLHIEGIGERVGVALSPPNTPAVPGAGAARAVPASSGPSASGPGRRIPGTRRLRDAKEVCAGLLDDVLPLIDLPVGLLGPLLLLSGMSFSRMPVPLPASLIRQGTSVGEHPPGRRMRSEEVDRVTLALLHVSDVALVSWASKHSMARCCWWWTAGDRSSATRGRRRHVGQRQVAGARHLGDGLDSPPSPGRA